MQTDLPMVPTSFYHSADPPVCMFQKDSHVFGSIPSYVSSYAIRQAVKYSGVGEDLMACVEHHFYMDYWLALSKNPRSLSERWPRSTLLLSSDRPVRIPEERNSAPNLCLLDSVDGPNEDDYAKTDGVLDPVEHRGGNVPKRDSIVLRIKFKWLRRNWTPIHPPTSQREANGEKSFCNRPKENLHFRSVSFFFVNWIFLFSLFVLFLPSIQGAIVSSFPPTKTLVCLNNYSKSQW